ncbi:MAG: hypothetical protein IPK85_04085 [Gemmatimonadetes bacterium]|nr:hypothetical protein [Gemmatimonadota bacterium]
MDFSKFAGEGATVQFRAPKLPDYMPTEAMRREVQFAFPGFPPALVQQVLLMAACYLRQGDDESDLAPAAELARLADSHMEAFIHLLNEFTGAFASSFGESVADAKNGSAA